MTLRRCREREKQKEMLCDVISSFFVRNTLGINRDAEEEPLKWGFIGNTKVNEDVVIGK